MEKTTEVQTEPAILNADHVNEIFMDCLFKAGEDTEKHIVAEGIRGTVEFHPERLESHREEIFEILKDLPQEFMESGGGGWSFLQACNDRDGHQWTGLYQRMDQLFQLGIGIEKVRCLMPREIWSALPGNMPYYAVLA